MISQQLDDWEQRALLALGRRVERAGERLSGVAGHLHAVSPLSILARGYSITSRDGDRAPLVSAEGVSEGDRIVTRLSHGRVRSIVGASVSCSYFSFTISWQRKQPGKRMDFPSGRVRVAGTPCILQTSILLWYRAHNPS